jgi:hypothetical protein
MIHKNPRLHPKLSDSYTLLAAPYTFTDAQKFQPRKSERYTEAHTVVTKKVHLP